MENKSLLDISVVILTLNEECHIRRCIENVSPWVREVFVVDCFSTDGTAEISKNLGAEVVQHTWPGNQAAQFNWALANLPIKTKWVLRLDADEYLSSELVEEIKAKLEKLPKDVTSVSFHLRRVFMGRVIRRGMPRIKMLRLFRYGKARCEQRLMDEHIELLEGRTVEFEGDFADHNLNDIGWWTAKHNGYALREAVDLLDMEYGILGGSNAAGAAGSNAAEAAGSNAPEGAGSIAADAAGFNAPDGAGLKGFKSVGGGLNDQAAEKRAKKMRYARMPLFWRAFVYFCYRYFLRGGFLEGKEGFLWHFLQGWWYRTLVDAKVWEIKRASGGDPQKMLELLRGKYGMKI
jgi:glycosyltransferase involved in cell wall biosynthesis